MPFWVSSLFQGPYRLASQIDLEFVLLTSLEASCQLAFRPPWNGVQFEVIFVEDAVVACPWVGLQVHGVAHPHVREVKWCSWVSAWLQD